MPRQVLFYGRVDNFNVASFLQSLENAKALGDGITMKLNSTGGDVMAGWGMITGFREFELEKIVDVHGEASSMAAFFLLYATRVIAIPQSNFILHRASIFFPDPTMNTVLRKINEDLRKAFEEKIDVDAFERIAGVTLDRFFDQDQEVIDVPITAQQALEIGLVTELKELNATEMTAINKALIAAEVEPIKGFKVKSEKKEKKKKSNVPQNPIIMNENELKTKHPDVWNAVFAKGQEAGKKDEQDRAGAWMAFVDVDPENVAKGIKSGEPLSQTAMAEFSRKTLNLQHGKDLEKDNPGNTANSQDPDNPAGEAGEGAQANNGDGKTTQKPDVAAFKADVMKNLGMKTKTEQS